jgi:2-oxoisovalerate dehydrogenase E2 component (dihydrolipoyl transacylase)
MARVEFRLPDVGEGTAEAEIVAWHVKVGDLVEEDAPLLDVMTDKATVEITAPVSGVIVETAGDVGAQAAIGSTVVVFETEESEADVRAPTPSVALHKPLNGVVAGGVGVQSEKVLASPAVRRRAKELGVDLADVKADATGARLTHADLEAYLKKGKVPTAPETHQAFEEVRVVGLRRKIAEQMEKSARRIPHFAYVEEVDVTELEELRAHLNATRSEGRAKLTVLPFILRALVRVLPDFPQINATFDDDAGVLRRYAAVHAGVATQTPNGLVVPVIRNAEGRDLWTIAAEIVRLADAARSGKATREELSGSTITVTSLGPLGGLAATPIINHPEVAIIGPNRIEERPVVRHGGIAVRKMMNLSSSFDHRIVDGHDAARFIQSLKAKLEHPATIWMD